MKNTTQTSVQTVEEKKEIVSRMKDEIKELDEKIKKLYAFIEAIAKSPELMESVGELQHRLLLIQGTSMVSYGSILDIRIKIMLSEIPSE